MLQGCCDVVPEALVSAWRDHDRHVLPNLCRGTVRCTHAGATSAPAAGISSASSTQGMRRADAEPVWGHLHVPVGSVFARWVAEGGNAHFVCLIVCAMVCLCYRRLSTSYPSTLQRPAVCLRCGSLVLQASQYKIPIYITETGIADKKDGNRSHMIDEYMRAVSNPSL